MTTKSRSASGLFFLVVVGAILTLAAPSLFTGDEPGKKTLNQPEEPHRIELILEWIPLGATDRETKEIWLEWEFGEDRGSGPVDMRGVRVDSGIHRWSLGVLRWGESRLPYDGRTPARIRATSKERVVCIIRVDGKEVARDSGRTGATCSYP